MSVAESLLGRLVLWLNCCTPNNIQESLVAEISPTGKYVKFENDSLFSWYKTQDIMIVDILNDITKK